VQPTIGASIVFDDNVFAQQTSNADTVLRISPGLSLIRVRPKAIFTGTYFLDAEKYQRFTELTTPQARQNGMFLAEFNPTRRRFWSVTGGYFSTTNPAELNTITALTVTRQRADRLQGGAKFRQELSRRVTFETGYTATHDDFVNGGTIAHLAEARLGHHLTSHSEVFARGQLQRFDFGIRGGVTVSNQLTGGWTWHGKDGHFGVEGGASNTRGEVQSTGNFSLGREFGRTDITGSYGRDVTSAVGYIGAITVDHVEFSLSRVPRGHVPTAEIPGRQPPGVRLAVRAGAARNVFPTGELRSYHAGFEFGTRVTETLLFVTDIEATMQDNVTFLTGIPTGDIIRNRAVISLQYSPWSVR